MNIYSRSVNNIGTKFKKKKQEKHNNVNNFSKLIKCFSSKWNVLNLWCSNIPNHNTLISIRIFHAALSQKILNNCIYFMWLLVKKNKMIKQTQIKEKKL